MAIYILTSNPTALLKAFKKAIDESTILTWGYDKDGDFPIPQLNGRIRPG